MIRSLFPELPPASRRPFGVCLAALLALLIGSALLRWQAPMIAVAAVGLPLVYVGYVREIRADRRVPIPRLLVAAAIGAALGVGWAYVAGTVFADGYDVALGFETTTGPTVRTAVIISVAEALLMLVPALVVRIAARSGHAPFDGHLVGALGATAFTAAGTVTLLAPQLAAGLVADRRSFGGLLVEAGIQGVALPLASAAVGGLFGVALWSRRAAAGTAVAVAVVLFTGFGLLDVAPFSSGGYVAGYLLIAALAVLAVWVALRGTAAPRGGRSAAHAARRLLVPTGAGVAVAAVVAVVASIVLTPEIPPYVCPPDCGRPPIGTPVETNPRFTAADGGFTVNYPGEGTAYEATFKPNGVLLDYTAGDTGTMSLAGEPAAGRTPKDITLELIMTTYPDATVDYEIPNVTVGYQPGYGVAADVYPQNSIGKYARLRVLVMVAVKHDYAVIAAAVGPYHQFSPDYGAGHPSGANLELAMDMGKYVNSFRWGADRFGQGY